MSKIIEFKVDIFQTGLNTTKVKVFKAKSVDRLMSSMSKSERKKWKKISYIENGKTKTIENG